jgi:hypothetical protein
MKLETENHHDEKVGIYAVSRKATRKHIGIANEMVEYVDTAEKEWADKYGMKAWAIAHAQLTKSAEPLCIFVVHPSLVEAGLNPLNAGFPSRTIFNAQILSAEKELITYKNVRKTVFNEKTGKREIHDRVPEKCTTPNIFEPKEGCMSFVHRKPKKVQRVYRITVRYWYPRKILGVWILWRRTEKVEGLKSQIFQHEIQHFEGSNIYFSNEKTA